MSMLTTWNNIREMEGIQSRMGRLFGRSSLPFADEPLSSSEWSPLVDALPSHREGLRLVRAILSSARRSQD